MWQRANLVRTAIDLRDDATRRGQPTANTVEVSAVRPCCELRGASLRQLGKASLAFFSTIARIQWIVSGTLMFESNVETNNRPMRLKILLTEGSSTSAREALYCLGRKHSIDIIDPSPICQCRFSRLVRRWYRCPSYSKDPLAYLKFLVTLLRREKYDVLFPTHEESFLLARVADEFEPLVGLTLPKHEALRRVYDKANYIRLLDEVGLPHPETVIVRTRSELEQEWDFPRYVKLAHGTAGQAVWRVNDKDELREIAEKCERDGVFDSEQEILVQQPVYGVQRDAGGMFQQGRLVAGGSCEGLMIGVAGASMQRISTANSEMIDHVRRVAEHLKWDGPFGMAAIYDPDKNQLYYLEAHPRIGETVNSFLGGVNACDLMVRMSLGEQVESAPNTRADVRTHQTFLILVTRALEGKGRLSILRELWSSLRGKGMYEGSEDELTRPREDALSLVPATAVTALLTAYPGAARWLIRRTVANYSLPGSAANAIQQISQEDLKRCFA